MKILCVRRGFVTNSSSDNFWFIVLEKKENAREEMARQIAKRRRVPMASVLKAIEQTLKNERYMHLGEYEGYGGTPCCLDVAYSLDLERLAEADDKTVSSLVDEVCAIVEKKNLWRREIWMFPNSKE